MKKQESELLKLLEHRIKSLGLDKEGRTYRKPELDPVSVLIAASAHAEVNRSDPFSRGRIAHYMRQGYELVSDVLADASSQHKARRHATRS